MLSLNGTEEDRKRITDIIGGRGYDIRIEEEYLTGEYDKALVNIIFSAFTQLYAVIPGEKSLAHVRFGDLFGSSKYLPSDFEPQRLKDHPDKIREKFQKIGQTFVRVAKAKGVYSPEVTFEDKFEGVEKHIVENFSGHHPSSFSLLREKLEDPEGSWKGEELLTTEAYIIKPMIQVAEELGDLESAEILREFEKEILASYKCALEMRGASRDSSPALEASAVELTRKILKEDESIHSGHFKHNCHMHTILLSYILKKLGIECEPVRLSYEKDPRHRGDSHYCVKTSTGAYLDAYPEGNRLIDHKSDNGLVLYPGDALYDIYAGADTENMLRAMGITIKPEYNFSEFNQQLETILEIFDDEISLVTPDMPEDVSGEDSENKGSSGISDAGVAPASEINSAVFELMVERAERSGTAERLDELKKRLARGVDIPPADDLCVKPDFIMETDTGDLVEVFKLDVKGRGYLYKDASGNIHREHAGRRRGRVYVHENASRETINHGIAELVVRKKYPEIGEEFGADSEEATKRYHDLARKEALEIAGTVRPLEAGFDCPMLHPAFTGHDMAVCQTINPEHKEGLSAVYGGSGADITSFLLSTDATEAYFIDSSDHIKITVSALEEAIDAWEEVGSHKTDKIYTVLKWRNGFSVRDALYDSTSRKIVLELKALGVTREDIIDVGMDQSGNARVRFKWTYPATREEKTYTVSFINADITKTDEYPLALNNVLKKNIDIYYQRAGMKISEAYASFMRRIGEALKNGGFCVTDDHSPIGVIPYPDMDKCLEDAGLSFTRDEALTSPEMRRWEELLFKIKPNGYGWRVRIRKKLFAKPEEPSNGTYFEDEGERGLRLVREFLQEKGMPANIISPYRFIAMAQDKGISVEEYLEELRRPEEDDETSPDASDVLIERATKVLLEFSNFKHDAISRLNFMLPPGIPIQGHLLRLKEMLSAVLSNGDEKNQRVPSGSVVIRDTDTARRVLFFCEFFVKELIKWHRESKSVRKTIASMKLPVDLAVDKKNLVLKNVRTIRRMLMRLKNFMDGIPQSLQYERLDVNSLIREELELFNVGKKVDFEEPLHVMADRVLLRRALFDVFKNAYEAAKENENPLLTVSTTKIAAGGMVEIRVRDNGAGIPSEDLLRIFDRFFTTKGSEGTGLGLGIIKDIITSHGGTIDINSGIGEGTTVIMRLPVTNGTVGEAVSGPQETMTFDEFIESLAGRDVPIAEDDITRINTFFQAELGRMMPGEKSEYREDACELEDYEGYLNIKFANQDFIKEQMREFVEWINSPAGERQNPTDYDYLSLSITEEGPWGLDFDDPEVFAAMALWIFHQVIHPFLDRNSRTGWQVMNLLRRRAGLEEKSFPEDWQSHQAYFETFRRDKTGTLARDPRPCLDFIRSLPREELLDEQGEADIEDEKEGPPADSHTVAKNPEEIPQQAENTEPERNEPLFETDKEEDSSKRTLEGCQAYSINFIKAIDDRKPHFIAVGTDWIKGYDRDNHPLEYAAINPLISSLRTFCEERGIPFICGDKDALDLEIGKIKSLDPDAYGVVLAGEDVIDELDLADDENVFLAAVNNEHLDANSYVPLVEMLMLLLRFSQKGFVINDRIASDYLGFKPISKRRISFAPNAEKMPIDAEPRQMYEVQIFA